MTKPIVVNLLLVVAICALGALAYLKLILLAGAGGGLS